MLECVSLVSEVSNNYNRTVYNYNGNDYRKRSETEAVAGYVLATAAAGIIWKALPSFSNPFLKQMKKEHANNEHYKDAFIKALNESGLEKKGVKKINMEFTPAERIQTGKGGTVKFADIKAGLNACYVPKEKWVLINENKATISGFHELGHAKNHLMSKFGRLLQKCRQPGYVIAGLMGTVAIFSHSKPKEAKRGVFDFIQDNCGKIAFLAMMPTVAEEALASIKGVNMAKDAGLEAKYVKNLKKFYGKALLSYLGYALVTGFSVFAASKITEYFTRPKKIET